LVQVWIGKVNLKDSKGKPYTTTGFDMWRIVDGDTDEHWDPMPKR
jgi:predicted SnoaL-like aldol condensation-catalyzing enzyme